MRLATWNVNSVNARAARLVAWLQRHSPDVVCLQELKCIEEKFPAETLRAAGYNAVVLGQRTYNGVAILARGELTDVRRGFEDGASDEQARLIAARVAGLTVVSAYVPNGQDIGSDKFAYKLAWLARLEKYVQERLRPQEPVVVCGDFNCAPDDRDVNRVADWRDSVLCHPDVRASLARLQAWGLVDAFRAHCAEAGHYSWWDYRMLGFPKNNGLRIDLILATAPIVQRLSRAWIDRDERKGKLPSDHAPVLCEIDL